MTGHRLGKTTPSGYPPVYPPNPRTHHTSSVEPNYVAKPDSMLTGGQAFILVLVCAVVGVWLLRKERRS